MIYVTLVDNRDYPTIQRQSMIFLIEGWFKNFQKHAKPWVISVPHIINIYIFRILKGYDPS